MKEKTMKMNQIIRKNGTGKTLKKAADQTENGYQCGETR